MNDLDTIIRQNREAVAQGWATPGVLGTGVDEQPDQYILVNNNTGDVITRGSLAYVLHVQDHAYPNTPCHYRLLDE